MVRNRTLHVNRNPHDFPKIFFPLKICFFGDGWVFYTRKGSVRAGLRRMARYAIAVYLPEQVRGQRKDFFLTGRNDRESIMSPKVGE